MSDLKESERESVTARTFRLVEDFTRAQEDVRHAEGQLNTLQCDLANAENALARWLTPDGAKPGEKFSIWFGNRLLEVEVIDQHSGKIRVRGNRK